MIPDPRPSARPDYPTLSQEHRRMLHHDSAVSPDVAAARGYRTITNLADLPPAFPPWQRRRGLLVPTHSPDGKTASYQLRPDKPIPRKSGAGPKYETPHGSRITLDVNPLMLEEVRTGEQDLWITEGCRKVDACTSRGLPTVGITGVWNFAEPGSKGTRPLPCWSHVRLVGRRVFVVYDADARTNPHVQEALRRLVAMLEEMGAVVLVVYLPPVSGDGKAGVDDYLAAGGTVEALRDMARSYEPVDVGRERLTKDEKLRAGLDDAWRRWENFDWAGLLGTGSRRNATRGHSCRDVVKVLLDRLPEIGRVRPDGIGFSWAQRPWSRDAAVSDRIMPGIIRHLEAEGWIKRVGGERAADKAASYMLPIPPSILQQEGSKGHAKGRQKDIGGYGRDAEGLRSGPNVPRLPWSSPGRRAHRRTVPGTRKVRQTQVPARDRIERPGKVRGAVIDFLILAGGITTVPEIAGFLRCKRADNVKRLISWLIEAGVVEIDGDTVRLAGDWSARLDVVRHHGGEFEARDAARERHRLQSQAFRANHRPGRRHRSTSSGPTPASLEALKRSRARREAEMIRTFLRASELERALDPEPEIVGALAAALPRWPDHADDYPSWWASTLYVEDYLPYKPTCEQVEVALHELGEAAA